MEAPKNLYYLVHITDYCAFKPDEMMLKIAEFFDIRIDDLTGKCNRRPRPDARKIFSTICRERTKLSLSEIGDFINRDHSTVSNQIEQAGNVPQVISKLKAFKSTLYDN